MTKEQAVHTIYKIINCEFIDLEIEDDLREICSRLENDDWDDDEDNEDNLPY